MKTVLQSNVEELLSAT